MHSDTDDAATDATPGTPGLGRRILVGVGVITVALSGGIGWFVGSNGELTSAAVLGTGVSIPVTPAAVAAYGVAVAVVLLGALFGLVELASRLERDGDSSQRPGDGGSE